MSDRLRGFDYPPPTLPAAGWHPDPDREAKAARWWDGGAWTYWSLPVAERGAVPVMPAKECTIRNVLARMAAAIAIVAVPIALVLIFFPVSTIGE